ncbi:MAG: alpha/beta hydrolase [Drouetiella hepatica Uher 2000/2452]|jgi:pimeloyl-ACP methyl ester carboxylesterase|uniref:Alpha/beta hydrolase n=1 Tax=Drouetiella hepatica Uher 2000/2452 TaxID=904376 RepID=A0A951Q9Z6_9CYAN|nr:alpha/beta hydrolase [Drouetiella hepatica Uher 2000/2452]
MTATSRLSLPIHQLTEAASIAIAQRIEYQDISTPLTESPIATAYVHHGKEHHGKQPLGKKSQGKSPMLLLHGFDSSVFEFRRLLPLLTQGETWAIDLLGFGFTERSPQLPVNPAAIKAHLYACWKTLIDEPVVLIGASMGGAAAIDFALTYPEAVKQLVLIDSAGFSAGFPLSKLITQPIGKWATAFLRNLKVRQNISLKAYYDASFASADALKCAALHLDRANWQQSLISFTQSGGYRSFKTRLAEIRQPTLILWGAQDRILGIQDAERLHQAIPQSQLVWIPQCGHVPHLEQPQITAAHILEFAR